MGRTTTHSSSFPHRLLPPGHRWGFGARTVLPYLNHSLRSQLLASDIVVAEEGPVRNPVFAGMEPQPQPQPR